MIICTNCFLQMAVNSHEASHDKGAYNIFRKIFKLDLRKNVYFFKNGKCDKKFPLEMSNSLYEWIEEYAIELKSKHREIEDELLEMSQVEKRTFRGLCESVDSKTVQNASTNNDYNQLEEKMEEFHKTMMDQLNELKSMMEKLN